MSFELPVAIVGMGCKFPGGSDTKDLYYEFIRNKGDGMVKPPSDRWDYAEWQGGNDEPGKYNSSMAGFINNINAFDPLEFGISFKEAQFMDPSIRLALEVAHQALMDSGIDYRGSYTGVYFSQLLTSTSEQVDDRYDINNYHGLGKCIALRANRVSFTFDLRGPSLVVDTACSSAATAMHLALSAIRLKEINQALIIGGNIVIHPQQMVSFSKLGVLSPTGSCKPFDAMADGYARAEGFAAVLVKRLDKAVADGDHVYSVITGSSINSNGKGMSPTTPDGAMQVETIIEAYSRAKRIPAEAFYVELHATGTPVGDPIEANAAGDVFSKGRGSKRLLRIGSVKSNIGHTEGCSFLASLIKVSLMLKRKEILPNIPFHELNPKINFAKSMMEVQTELEPLTSDFAAPDGKWVTSVSCHGIGGSNAHVVFESFESTHELPLRFTSACNPMYLFIFAAATETSIPRWKDSLISTYKDVTDCRLLRSLSRDLARLSRTLPSRAFAVGSAMSSTLELSKYATIDPNVNPKLCLVFAGQGPQHPSMGKILSSTFRAFWDSVKCSDDILVEKYGQESFLKRSGLFLPGDKVNLPEGGMWPVQDVVYSIVFVQLALVDLIQSFGIKCDCVVGHSLGEVAMGYASGHYSKETALGIAISRAKAMEQAEGNGSVVALGVGVQKAKSMIEETLRSSKSVDGLWIAAINSPTAVAVAGRHELIDALIEHAARHNRIFVTKLRVTCAFHTPLMEPHEGVFKQAANSALSDRANAHVARVMSTVDGKWLDRDLDVDYCWDNIRQPVLFGTAIHQIIKGHRDGGVLFMEVAPHPVLSAYIDQCGGKSINLMSRPNPTALIHTNDEHCRLLEGIGQLLIAGFKDIDLSRFYAAPDGIKDLVKCNLPEHPYDRSLCWGESAEGRSIRLRPRPRPLASSMFRLSVDTHPDLAGHVILGTPLFPASGYLESVLENGAMIVKDVQFHRSLILNSHGNSPAYVGCIVHDDKWEFRGATTNDFDNGNIELDTIYATGTFLLENPRSDPHHPNVLDVDSMLARSRGFITGEEFYKALPSAYGYREHFSDYVEEVHEVTDENSWFGVAYLAKLDIPARSQDFLRKSYVIHPSILDSIIHSTLAIFMNIDTKLSDIDDVFLPVKINTVCRWDSTNFVHFIPGLRDVVWVYITVRAFAPEGPIKFDYTVTDSQCRVILTMDGFESVLAPQAVISDISTDERLTTIWQPKDFPSSNFTLHSTISADVLSDLRSNFEALLANALMAGRHVVRVLDMDRSSEIAKALDTSLVSFLNDGLFVDYFFPVTSAEDVDVNLESLQYSRIRPFGAEALDDKNRGENSLYRTSFDVLLQMVNVLRVPPDFVTRLDCLVPFGVILLVVEGRKFPEESYKDPNVWQHDIAAFVEKLQALPRVEVSMAQSDADALILIRCGGPYNEIDKVPAHDVVIHHFQHGNEGEIADIVTNLSDNSELWIVGNDDAPGAGALGIVACVSAESPDYTIHSLIFENHGICPSARERTIHSLRETSLHLEQHLKYTRGGEIFVRRLIYGSSEFKDTAAPGTSVHRSKGIVSSHFPPSIQPTDVQISVRAIGVDSPPSEQSLVSFVGKVNDLGADIKSVSIETDVVGITTGSITDIVVVDQNAVVALPDGLTDIEAAALPIASLAAWVAFVKMVRISDEYTVLIHDASSRIGVGAVQICQRFGAKCFCTALTVGGALELSTLFNVAKESVAIVLPGDDVKFMAQKWLMANDRVGFDVIFNPQGSSAYTGIELLGPMSHYIHIQRIPSDRVDIPSGAPTTNVINMYNLLKHQPSTVASCLSGLLIEHTLAPFKVPVHAVPFSHITTSVASLSSPTTSLVVIPDMLGSAHIDSAGQLFDPRKTYLLLGGSSELGVRIARWMVARGARHLVLTSRRGAEALTKIDLMYLHYLRLENATVDVFAADASDRQDMMTTINRANDIAPLDGIFLMTVVLRDATISRLSQQSFDDVYHSKVHALNTLLSCVNTADLRFLLLFSTIGSVFGNAGQAAYCASQSYLDRIAEVLPNTISISLPPITDSGMFKRLIRSMKGRPHVDLLTKAGITVAKACSFIGDCLVRKIAHYVPMSTIKLVPVLFPTCEPRLYSHLLPKRLLAADRGGFDVTSTKETPTTLLAAIVGLKPEQISESSVITRFGLDSLGAVRFSNELKAHFNIKISQAELLGPATIQYIDEKLRDADKTLVGYNLIPDVEQDDGTAKYGTPLRADLNESLAYGGQYVTDATPHQCRIWHAQAQSNGAVESVVGRSHHQSSQDGATQWSTHEGYLFIIRFSKPVDATRMRRAMAEIIHRHGALRTTFSWSEEGTLKQMVNSTLDFETEVVDLSYEVDAMQIAYEMSLTAHKNPNFLLDRLPLLMLTIFNLGDGEWGFNVVFHHIIMDKSSLGIIFRELLTLYLMGTENFPLPRLHYSDFTDWLLRTSDVRAQLRNDQLKFWTDNLKDVQPLYLTLTTPTEQLLSPIAQVETAIDVRPLKRFYTLISEAEATPFSGFFAAYNVLLFKCSSQASFIVGTVITQRDVAQLAKVVGFFGNILPIKTNIDANQTFLQYLKAFKGDLLKSMANNDVAYEDILAQCRDPSSFDGFLRHTFAFAGLSSDAIEQLEWDGIQVQTIIPMPIVGNQYELSLTVHNSTGRVVLQFDNHIFSEETARIFLDAYVTLIKNLGREPNIKVDEVSVMANEFDCLGVRLSRSEGASVKLYAKKA